MSARTQIRAATRTAGSVAAGLRVWAEGHDPHVRAAVELLIRHGAWLRRVEFLAIGLHRDPAGSYWIDWTAARRAFDGGRFDHAGIRDRAVLDLALDLGMDRYRLSVMGTGNARLIADTVTTALGLAVARRSHSANGPDLPAPPDDKPGQPGGSEPTP